MKNGNISQLVKRFNSVWKKGEAHEQPLLSISDIAVHLKRDRSRRNEKWIINAHYSSLSYLFVELMTSFCSTH